MTISLILLGIMGIMFKASVCVFKGALGKKLGS